MQYNYYDYGLNNPSRYTDPSGHIPIIDEDEDGNPIVDPNWRPGGNRSRKDKDDPPGHEYATSYLVCPAVFDCTEDEMMKYLRQFQYPGQLPWKPVSDLEDAIVFPARFWDIPVPLFYYGGNQGLGAIVVDISDDRLTITNYSQSTHIFHKGQVERTLERTEEGWYVVTHGTGTNVRTSEPEVNRGIDAVNQLIGPSSFMYLVDQPMRAWIIADQILDDARSYLSTRLP